MGVLRVLGFALVCSLVLVVLDYFQQGKRSDGRLSFEEYVRTIEERAGVFRAGKAAQQDERSRQARWDAGGQSYLPTAPEGWQRRSLLSGDNSGLTETNPAAAVQADTEQVAATGNRDSADEERAVAQDKRGWVYQRGDEVIWVEVMLKEAGDANSLTGLMAQRVAGSNFYTGQQQGYAVLGGVGFVYATYGDSSELGPNDLRKFIGRIGFDEEVNIIVVARATDDAIGQILGTIDYDGLNGLLSEPIMSVGSGAPVQQGDQVSLAQDMNDLRGRFLKLQGEVAGERLANSDDISFLLSTLAQDNGFPTDLFDFTDGRVPEIGDALQAAYRRELSKLVGGDAQQADARSGISNLFASLMSFIGKSEQTGTSEENATVLVHKGGFVGGSATCVVRDSLKTCSGFGD